MYAIVDIAGQQFKVEKNSRLYVHRLAAKEGDKVEFNKVMLIDDDGKVNLGTPVIEGAMVSASVVAHVRGDKVKVFKKKRRKGYQKLNGHRQDFSEILIDDILAKGASKAKAEDKKTASKTEAKTEETAPAAPVTETKKEPATKAAEEKAPAKENKSATKKPAAKATAEKKEAAPKAEEKKAAPKKTAKPTAEKKEDKKSEDKE
ncbi:MAG: 50S ribosomal protein L21 [Bacteroidota bacterium]